MTAAINHVQHKNNIQHQNLKKIFELTKGKEVFIATHYDADGITSGAIIYHLIKNNASKINTTSKGLVFRIEPEDISGNPDVIICTDIKPSQNLDPKKVIYIDHHPMQPNAHLLDDFLFYVFDHEAQSCSFLIWRDILQGSKFAVNSYMVFLTLLGYFGDGGKADNLPIELQVIAGELLQIETKRGIHNLMEKKKSFYGSGKDYLEIERYVSALNTGKRMHWHGNVPFELMKSIDDIKLFIYNLHPIAEVLQDYKKQLREYYEMPIEIHNTKRIQYAVIECDKNIQGVLASRHLKHKPLMVMNKLKDIGIASMRVPDHLNFDAGAFLSEFNGKIESLTGGGHEKAGGVTLARDDFDRFVELLN